MQLQGCPILRKKIVLEIMSFFTNSDLGWSSIENTISILTNLQQQDLNYSMFSLPFRKITGELRHANHIANLKNDFKELRSASVWSRELGLAALNKILLILEKDGLSEDSATSKMMLALIAKIWLNKSEQLSTSKVTCLLIENSGQGFVDEFSVALNKELNKELNVSLSAPLINRPVVYQQKATEQVFFSGSAGEMIIKNISDQDCSPPSIDGPGILSYFLSTLNTSADNCSDADTDTQEETEDITPESTSNALPIKREFVLSDAQEDLFFTGALPKHKLV